MEVFAVEGLPEVRPGDDVAGLLVEQADLRDDDVICVASTIVSKANGRGRSLSSYEPSARAERIAATIEDIAGEEKDPRMAQAILDECTEVLVEAPFILGVTEFGHITVNAGIDRSNVPGADLLLLPENPTAEAEAIRAGIREQAGVEPSVIVTDTSGRPFRLGQRGVALAGPGSLPLGTGGANTTATAANSKPPSRPLSTNSPPRPTSSPAKATAERPSQSSAISTSATTRQRATVPRPGEGRSQTSTQRLVSCTRLNSPRNTRSHSSPRLPNRPNRTRSTPCTSAITTTTATSSCR